MLNLSTAELRYLTAACSASPLYAFRPRAMGRLASFADGDTDVIVSSLRRAGLIEMDSDRHARLTELGRGTARGLAITGARRAHGWNTVEMVALSLGAVIALAVAGLLLL
jgi:hypothetical protein